MENAYPSPDNYDNDIVGATVFFWNVRFYGGSLLGYKVRVKVNIVMLHL